MNEWLIVAFDIVSCIAFSAAFVAILMVPLGEYGSHARVVRTFFALAIAVYVLVGVSNILEHAGITAALDAYEDYAEVLFVPLVAYALFASSTAMRENDLRRASELVRAEQCSA